MIETLFRALLLAQPFFWMWVLEDEDSFDILDDVNAELWFGVLVFLWVAMIAMFQPHIGFYTPLLLSLYASMVWLAVTVCHREYCYSFKDSLALGFLIVYLNSWYWEGFLHVWAIQENGLNMNQIYQLLHLIPAIYFITKWEFDVQASTNKLLIGWCISGLMAFARGPVIWSLPSWLYVMPLNRMWMVVNRLISFYFLFEAIIRWGIPKKYVEPKEKELPHYRTRF